METENMWIDEARQLIKSILSPVAVNQGSKGKLIWECKYCGQNEKPKCHQCVREDGLIVTDELVEE